MLGSGLLLKIDEGKAHLPGVALSSGPVDVSSACEVCVGWSWAQPADTPRAAGRTFVRQGSGVFFSLQGQRSGLWGSGGWCGLSCVSSDSSGAVE